MPNLNNLEPAMALLSKEIEKNNVKNGDNCIHSSEFAQLF